mgnify:CR=1 FL=1
MWTDKTARKTIIKLQQDFSIQTVIETGTYKGANAEWLRSVFPFVYTVEINLDYCKIAEDRLIHSGFTNWQIVHDDSPSFLSQMVKNNGFYFFYLDAHFYDPSRKQKWVVIDELKALEGFGDCIIAIHDFDNGVFDHLIYDGEHLGWNVVHEHIRNVNPNFFYYTNTECDIYTEETIEGLTVDETILDNLRRYKGKDKRGILYAVPRELDLSKYKLREL